MRVLIFLIACIYGAESAGLFTIGYHAQYQSSTIKPGAIDYSKLTHIALGAISCDSTGTITVADGYSMSQWTSFVNSITPLAHGNGTKTHLMFGGADANSGCPGNINGAVSDTYYQTFAQNLVTHAKSLSFDGIDLDWETCLDYPKLTRLAQTIRSLWPSVFLTFPVGILGIQNTGDANYPSNYASLVPYIDAINMMSYSPIDNWGGWDGPWHVSPLTGNTANHPYAISLAYTTMIANGIPASKIGIGMGFFGSCWGSPITRPVQSLGSNNLIASDNDMSYHNIEASYRASMKDNWDASAQAPYLNSTTAVGPKGCTYISYDNDQSIKAKADYVKSNGLAGLIIWTVGEGILANGSSPALTSVKNYFGRSFTTTSSATSSVASTTATVTTTTGTTTGSTTGSSGTYVTLYADSLVNPFVDGSWATINLQNTNPVHSGTKSVSFTPVGWDALYFYSSPGGYINPAIHDGVEFYINGGATGGQNILFDIVVNGNRVTGFSKTVASVISGGIPKNAWAMGYISFSTLPAGNYDGMWWQENTGGTQGVVYIDDVRIKLK